MTETSVQTAPRLWTEQGFQEDEWNRAEDGGALAGNQRVILPIDAYLAIDSETRAASADRIGVSILPGETLDAIVPHLGSIQLISLAFPAFSDGRSYSKAVHLRTQLSYEGTIRAAGDVLIDQIPLMLRTGFSEFEVTNETALRRLGQGNIGGVAFRYQPSAVEEAPGARYSWRRVSTA